MTTTGGKLKKLTAPTLYFVGVSTAKSSIMNVFPKWSDILGLGANIVGYDAPLHAPAEVYERIVQHIKDDPLAKGALVTTHKIDLYNATAQLFDEFDSYARLCGEVSCISKREDKLIGHAKDPISSGLALQAFISAGHFDRGNAQVLCFGAGGAAVAISLYFANLTATSDRPARFTVVDINQHRLEHLKAIHSKLGANLAVDYVLNSDATENDALLSALPPSSLVINATGMGKDRPGSPLSDEGIFPLKGIAWELNYRGELRFLQQAKRQQQARELQVEDGWIYFLHGWTQVIAEVFDLELSSEIFKKLNEVAAALRS